MEDTFQQSGPTPTPMAAPVAQAPLFTLIVTRTNAPWWLFGAFLLFVITNRVHNYLVDNAVVEVRHDYEQRLTQTIANLQQTQTYAFGLQQKLQQAETEARVGYVVGEKILMEQELRLQKDYFTTMFANEQARRIEVTGVYQFAAGKAHEVTIKGLEIPGEIVAQPEPVYQPIPVTVRVTADGTLGDTGNK